MGFSCRFRFFFFFLCLVFFGWIFDDFVVFLGGKKHEKRPFGGEVVGGDLGGLEGQSLPLGCK